MMRKERLERNLAAMRDRMQVAKLARFIDCYRCNERAATAISTQPGYYRCRRASCCHTFRLDPPALSHPYRLAWRKPRNVFRMRPDIYSVYRQDIRRVNETSAEALRKRYIPRYRTVDRRVETIYGVT